MRPLPLPPVLQPGDRIAVVSPSSAVPRDRVELGLERLRAWGFEVAVGDHVWDEHPVSSLAGSDADRAADLLAAWHDPQVAAVICARGGFGSQRLLEQVPAGAFARSQKALVGFSDVTPLLHRVAAEAGVATIHGPVVTGIGDHDPVAAEHLRRLLVGEVPTPLLEGMTPWVDGEATGHLVGGNVALLASCVGTGDLLPADGGVVVVEDLGQPAYVLDRGLTQLRRSGWLDGVAAVVVGQHTMTSPPEEVEAVLRDRLTDLGVPVWAGAVVGHELDNRAVPVGAQVTLAGGALTLG